MEMRHERCHGKAEANSVGSARGVVHGVRSFIDSKKQEISLCALHKMWPFHDDGKWGISRSSKKDREAMGIWTPEEIEDMKLTHDNVIKKLVG